MQADRADGDRRTTSRQHLPALAHPEFLVYRSWGPRQICRYWFDLESAMVHTRVQVHYARDILRVDDLEIHDLIDPILTAAVPILRCNCERVLSAAEEAIQLKFYFENITGFKPSEIALFKPGVGSKHAHADAAANQYAGHGVIHRAIEPGCYENANRVAAPKCTTRFTAAIRQAYISDVTRAVSMSKRTADRTRI